MNADPGTRFGRLKLIAPLILEACATTGERKERLISLAYRESLCSFALDPPGDPCGWGDNKNGFGLFQIDRRYHPNFIALELAKAAKEGQKYNPINQALYACSVLKDARRYFIRSALNINGDALERAVYAAYNAGPHAVYTALMNRQDVDSRTTKKNYSAYIFAMATALGAPRFLRLWD